MFLNIISDFKVYKFQKRRNLRMFFHFIIDLKVYKRQKRRSFRVGFLFSNCSVHNLEII